MARNRHTTLTTTDGQARTIGSARATLAPRWARARSAMREEVTPAVVEAVRSARETSAPARAEARERTRIAVRALRGQQRAVRRWPTAIGFFAIGTGAGIVAATAMRRVDPPREAPMQDTPMRRPEPAIGREQEKAAFAP